MCDVCVTCHAKSDAENKIIQNAQGFCLRSCSSFPFTCVLVARTSLWSSSRRMKCQSLFSWLDSLSLDPFITQTHTQVLQWQEIISQSCFCRINWLTVLLMISTTTLLTLLLSLIISFLDHILIRMICSLGLFVTRRATFSPEQPY